MDLAMPDGIDCICGKSIILGGKYETNYATFSKAPRQLFIPISLSALDKRVHSE
jgi:hypothetical protein